MGKYMSLIQKRPPENGRFCAKKQEKKKSVFSESPGSPYGGAVMR
jgi:hypothetical protein